MHPLTTRYLKSSTRVVFNFSHIYVQQYWRYRFLVSVATKDRRVMCPCDVISNILYMARSVFLCFWAYEIHFWAASVIWIENQKFWCLWKQNFMSSLAKNLKFIFTEMYLADYSAFLHGVVFFKSSPQQKRAADIPAGERSRQRANILFLCWAGRLAGILPHFPGTERSPCWLVKQTPFLLLLLLLLGAFQTRRLAQQLLGTALVCVN